MKAANCILSVIKLMLIGLLIVIPGIGLSQVDSAILNRIDGFSVGIGAGFSGSYPGKINFEVTSPLFLKKRLSLRINGGWNWLESGESASYHVTTLPSLGASIIYQSLISERMRFYAEMGTFALRSSKDLSSSGKITGYSGTAGLEFFSRASSPVMLSYFFGGGISMCVTGSGESDSHDDYGDGFIFMNGLRIYF